MKAEVVRIISYAGQTPSHLKSVKGKVGFTMGKTYMLDPVCSHVKDDTGKHRKINTYNEDLKTYIVFGSLEKEVYIHLKKVED